MPVYEYKCRKCGKEFEYSQRITEDALSYCPIDVCEEEIKGFGSVERKISKNVGLVFKGSGFYLTDYAKKTVYTSFNKL